MSKKLKIKTDTSGKWVSTDEVEKMLSDVITLVESNYVGSVHSHASTWNNAVQKCANKIKENYVNNTN